MNAQISISNRSLLGILALTAALGAAGLGCAPDVSDLRLEGVQQFRNHQYIESMATLRYTLELAPSDARSNYYMGLNYRTLARRKFREGDIPSAYRELDTAVGYFTQAIKSWPNYMEAIASKNEALEARGKYAEALALADNATKNNRGDAAEHFIYLGNEYRERGDYDNALRRYKIALATDPNSAKAYASMGKLYHRVGNLALARDSYRRAYELNENEPGVSDALEQLQTGSDIHTAAHEPKP